MEGALNSGDTAWLLVCCSLVLLMTPALALFYGGMVRRKNLLSTLTLSYIFMALAGVQWVLYGYSLAFGTDIGGLIGGLNFLGFNGVGAAPQPGLCQDHPARTLRRLPDDVRGDHPGPDHRGVRGTGAVQILFDLQPHLDDPGV